MAIILKCTRIKSEDGLYEINANSLSDQNKADIRSAGLSDSTVTVDGIFEGSTFNPDRSIKLSTLFKVGNPNIIGDVFSSMVVIGGQNGAVYNLEVQKFKFDDSAKILLTDSTALRAAGGSSNGRDLVTFGGNQGSYNRFVYRVDAESATYDAGRSNRVNCQLNGRKAAVVNNGVDWIQGSRYHFSTPQTDNFEKYNLESNTDALMTYTITTPITEAAMAGNKTEFVIMGGIEFFGVLNSDIHKVHYDDSVTGSVATNSMQTAGGKGSAIHYEGDIIHAMDNVFQLVKLDDSAAVVRQSNSPTLNMVDGRLAQDGNGDFIRTTGFTSGSGIVTSDIFKYKIDDSAAELIMTNQLTAPYSGAVVGESI